MRNSRIGEAFPMGATVIGKRAVQFRGGRTCFGPRPRNFGFSIPKKIVKKALSYVLLNKIKEELLQWADRR